MKTHAVIAVLAGIAITAALLMFANSFELMGDEGTIYARGKAYSTASMGFCACIGPGMLGGIFAFIHLQERAGVTDNDVSGWLVGSCVLLGVFGVLMWLVEVFSVLLRLL